ncbi:ubiquitin-conjugating enzyme E2 U [Discoglossus pictus]
MRSRAYLLLEREYQELNEARLYGIFVTPLTENLLEWVAKVQGLKDSLWEGAILQITLTYTEKYNHLPPSIVFNTIPFHPNVDQSSGKPCIGFLDNPEEWNTGFTMTSILLTIQSMLSNPVAENAVNLEAARILKTDPCMYRQTVLDCVKFSRQIESGSIPDFVSLGKTQTSDTSPGPRKIKSVSFEDYHRTWSEIATSKAAEDEKHMESSWKTPCNEPQENMNTNNICNFIISGIVNNTSKAKTSQHTTAGRVSQDCPLCRLSQTCNLESTSQLTEKEPLYTNKPKCEVESMMSRQDESRNGEPWEQEVENLVAWTNSLNTELLDY